MLAGLYLGSSPSGSMVEQLLDHALFVLTLCPEDKAKMSALVDTMSQKKEITKWKNNKIGIHK